MNNKNGFTIAETLVALAIIGVLAGIMLPVLNNSRPNQEMVLLKKAYYLTGQAVSELINDDTLYPETDNNLGFANTEPVEYRGQTYRGNTKFCGLLAAKMNSTCNNGSFTTSDGMNWTVSNGSFSAITPVGGFANSATVRVNVRRNETQCLDSNQRCRKPNTFDLIISRDGFMRLHGYLGALYIAEKDNTKQANKFTVDRTQSLNTNVYSSQNLAQKESQQGQTQNLINSNH